MGKYFNIIEAFFASIGQVKDLTLLGWIVLSFIVGGVLSFVSMAIHPLLFVLMLPVLIVVGMVFQLKIHQRVMVVQQMPMRESVSYVDWIWLNIRRFFVDAFCWYDKKLLIPVVLGIILAIGAVALIGFSAMSTIGKGSSSSAAMMSGMMGASFVVLMAAYLAFIIWFIFAFTIHGTRTKFMAWNYLSGKTDAGMAIRESNALIKGQTIEALLPSFMNFYTVYMVAYLAIVPAYILMFVLMGIGGGIGAVLGGLVLICVMFVVFSAMMAQCLIIEAGLFKFWTGTQARGEQQTHGHAVQQQAPQSAFSALGTAKLAKKK